MKHLLVPLCCFAIGLACGKLLLSSNKHDPGSPSAAENGRGKSPASTLGSAISGPRESPAEHDTGHAPRTGSGALSGQIDFETLLDLAGNGYSAHSLLTLARTIEHLDTPTLLELAQELETISQNDHRAWQVRNALLAGLAGADPQAALAHLESITNLAVRRQSLGIVIAEIARTDLAAALAILNRTEDVNDYRMIARSIAASGPPGAADALLSAAEQRSDGTGLLDYHQMYLQWARKDFPAAIARFDQLPKNGSHRSSALQAIGQTITAENLDSAMTLFHQLERHHERQAFINASVHSLALHSPEKALELLNEYGDATQRHNVLNGMFTQWFSTDPEKAKAWVESLPARDRMSALRNSAYNDNLDRDWLAAQIETFPANHQSKNLADNLAQRWAESDPQAATEWLNSLPASRSNPWSRQNIAQRWAEKDPAAAAAYFAQRPITDGNGGRTAGLIAGALARQDPEGALAWLETLDIANEEARVGTTAAMLDGWAQGDPEAAGTYALSLDDADQRRDAIVSLARGWSQNDPGSARAWIDALEDPQLRHQALGSHIESVAALDPAGAAEIFTEISAGLADGDPPNQLRNSVKQIASHWAQVDPQAAAEWASTLPPETHDPGKTFSLIVQTWAEYEPREASEWLSTLDEGPERDGSVFTLVSTIAPHDPEGAFAWATTIGDPSNRDQAVQRTINNWRRTDQEAARAAVESANISDSLREQLLEDLGG